MEKSLSEKGYTIKKAEWGTDGGFDSGGGLPRCRVRRARFQRRRTNHRRRPSIYDFYKDLTIKI